MDNLAIETELWQKGYRQIAGLDEVGRGTWAGDVYTAAVILPADPAIAVELSGVKDSKKMSVKQREKWAVEIKQRAVAWSIGIATVPEIDELNILQATKLAMRRAIAALSVQPDFLVLDALHLDGLEIPQAGYVKGDSLSLTISCASVLAKVARDAAMDAVSQLYPGYAFEVNKGYGTPAHIQGLKTIGVCPIHRRTFQPIKSMVGGS